MLPWGETAIWDDAEMVALAPVVDTKAEADPGNKVIAVDVQIKNTGTEPLSYNPFAFQLQDSQGYSWEHSYAYGAKEPVSYTHLTLPTIYSV